LIPPEKENSLSIFRPTRSHAPGVSVLAIVPVTGLAIAIVPATALIRGSSNRFAIIAICTVVIGKVESCQRSGTGKTQLVPCGSRSRQIPFLLL